MVPVFGRSHVLPLGEDPDEVGLIVETAVITYLGDAQRGIYQHLAGLRHSQVVHISDERDSCFLLEEMTESGI